jgi:NAD(P)-dependent dehydrogenase (short-subunit alcohol dehydrogenase family)
MATSELQPANNHKSAVITGASTGIGYACAAALLEHDYRVFGSVRRVEDGDRLRQEFGPGFTPLIFDVTDAAAVQQAAEMVEVLLAGRGLSALINNAGIAEAGPLQYLPMAQLRSVFETNVFGVIQVTQAFLGRLPSAASLPKRRPNPAGSSTSVRSAGGFPFPFWAPMPRRNMPWRRSPTPCGGNCWSMASM